MPSRREIVARARSLASARALSGYLLILISTLDWAQRYVFVRDLLGSRGVEILTRWGWVLGVAWLTGVVFLADSPSRANRARDRALVELPHALLNVARRFEQLCQAFEAGPRGQPVFRRMDLDDAVTHALDVAFETVPERDRWHYSSVLDFLRLEYMRSFDSQSLSELGRQISPMTAVKNLSKLDLSRALAEETVASAPVAASQPRRLKVAVRMVTLAPSVFESREDSIEWAFASEWGRHFLVLDVTNEGGSDLANLIAKRRAGEEWIADPVWSAEPGDRFVAGGSYAAELRAGDNRRLLVAQAIGRARVWTRLLRPTHAFPNYSPPTAERAEPLFVDDTGEDVAIGRDVEIEVQFVAAGVREGLRLLLSFDGDNPTATLDVA